MNLRAQARTTPQEFKLTADAERRMRVIVMPAWRRLARLPTVPAAHDATSRAALLRHLTKRGSIKL
jgi:hypothetical protein